MFKPEFTRGGCAGADGHQFQRPRSATVAGTRRVRTKNASIKMPRARMSQYTPPPGGRAP
jgi:hypothetical protein